MADFNLPVLVDVSASQATGESSRPPAEKLIAGEPMQTVHNCYTDATQQYFAGVWQSTVGAWRVRYTETEFCHITRGRVRITDARGDTRVFGAGAAFVIPSGFEGTWEVLEDIEKHYVIFEPKE